jgi:hypothetical protein
MPRLLSPAVSIVVLPGVLGACQTAASPSGPLDEDGGTDEPTALVFRSDVMPVMSTDEALPGVFIPPFETCRDPEPGESGAGRNGKVCTNSLISACTEPGKYFADYGSCDVVRTQRPFWEEPPANEPAADDPRIDDAAFMDELAWMTQQVEACACVCCHDSRSFGGRFGQWDIALGPIWLDTLSDEGLVLFAGLADSTTLGAYPAEQNHGFDRTRTGIPTTDTARMQAFLNAELERRGISAEDAAEVPPFGGPLYTLAIAEPPACKPGEGIDEDGRIRWLSGEARYIHVAEQGTDNPGVPPNLDLPEGTLWRLDVLASAEALASGVRYATTPKGSFQTLPESREAPELVRGQIYHLTVLADPGLPLANCEFEFGAVQVEPEPLPDAGAPGDGDGDGIGNGACKLSGADERGFGATCKSDDDCTCEASYCAIMPASDEGYCTMTGCGTKPEQCPADWYCLDLSVFSAELPQICAPQ